MRVALGRHGMDETHLIGQPRKVRKQIGDHLPALITRLEGPQGSNKVSVLALKSDELVRSRHRLTIAFHQLGLVIPRVHMADCPGAKYHQYSIRPGRKMRWPRCIR